MKEIFDRFSACMAFVPVKKTDVLSDYDLFRQKDWVSLLGVQSLGDVMFADVVDHVFSILHCELTALVHLLRLLAVIGSTSDECERAFSDLNVTKTQWKSRMSLETVENLLHIRRDPHRGEHFLPQDTAEAVAQEMYDKQLIKREEARASRQKKTT